MRITSIDVLSASTAWRNLILVRLGTDTGLSGWGEATIEYGDRALLAYLPEIFSRAVRGRDPLDVDAVMAAMVRADYWRSGFIARTAFSAIEMACWDIKGHHEQLPVWRLLGGARSEPLPAYANGWYRTERDPERMAEAARGVVARGYRALKIDPFGAGDLDLSLAELDRSLAIVREVRRAVGDRTSLMVEAHGRFDLACALRIASALEPYAPAWLEEPLVPELNHSLGELIRATSIPIAIGERLSSPEMFEPLLTGNDHLILQPDLCHVGGFNAARKVAILARDRGLRLAPHNAGGPLATTLAAHFGLATPEVMAQEVFDDFEEAWVLEAFPGRAGCDSGCLSPSNSPGLGISVRSEILAGHPFQDVHLDLFDEGWEQRKAERTA